jgi:Fur family transcriptional regulator, ferric uptake regulator
MQENILQHNCKLRHNQTISFFTITMNAKQDHPAPINAQPQNRALAESRLRSAAVRVTAARVSVLAALIGARRAFSHQDVQDTLTDMDRVTLYRALDCLIEAGLAHKIAGDDRVFRYSAGTDHGEEGVARHALQHQHSHFKCTRCAKVFCLDTESATDNVMSSQATSWHAALNQELQKTLLQTLGAGFQSHDIELTIKGWCADCAH